MDGLTRREREEFQEKAPVQDTEHLFELLVQAVVSLSQHCRRFSNYVEVIALSS